MKRLTLLLVMRFVLGIRGARRLLWSNLERVTNSLCHLGKWVVLAGLQSSVQLLDGMKARPH